MAHEYQVVLKIMKTHIRLSSYNPKQKLKLVIDGAKTVGTGLLLIQNIIDENPKKGITIINAGSCLLPDDRDYSSVETEAIALSRDVSMPSLDLLLRAVDAVKTLYPVNSVLTNVSLLNIRSLLGKLGELSS